eukprot:CAMPEP_0117418962 /NCGR_PEP_ID=MMETSP0758-20121206/639_1 /TAXON_ID=63605 /ORGANISM="Percolomonas cosmopolitus, Strain AE-1 (ATCC 50343)" /LENGTH=446 /DNA_ID=CAMNT_0005199781 /DNA_START=90 /DNA_END=1426 /DNA_ORIENTATION=-
MVKRPRNKKSTLNNNRPHKKRRDNDEEIDESLADLDMYSKKKKARFDDDGLFMTSSEDESEVEEDALERPPKTADEIRVEEAQKRLEALRSQVGDDEKELKKKLLEEKQHIYKSTINSITNQTSNYRYTHTRGHKKTPTCVTLTKDDKQAFTGGKDCTVIQWDVTTQKKIGCWKGSNYREDGHSDYILSIDVCSDGKYVCTGSRDGTIKIWDPRDPKGVVIDTLTDHFGFVNGVVFQKIDPKRQQFAVRDIPLDYLLYSASSDRTIRVWNIEERALVNTLYGHTSDVHDIDVLYEEIAISGGQDRGLHLWKFETESQLKYSTSAHTTPINSVSMINEKLFLTGSQDGSIAMHSKSKMKPIHQFNQAHGGEWITTVSSRPFTDQMISGGPDGTVKIWEANPKSGFRLHHQLHLKEGQITDSVFGHHHPIALCTTGREQRLGRWKVIP